MLEKKYQIENFNFSQITKERKYILSCLDLTEKPDVQKAVLRAQENYLSWEEFKNKDWVPGDKKKVWAIVKLNRSSFYNKETPILDQEGRSFVFDARNYVEFQHQVDLELGGNFMGIDNFTEGDRQRFIRRNLIEESIASSQLEGANTSRSVAKKMLQVGRAPRNKGEQMIVNNHETMKWIEEELKNRELSLELLMELHRRVTRNTIDEAYQGVLRNTLNEKGNRLVVKPWDDETVAYVTPDREFVESQLPQLIKFANDKDGSGFIHPLIKAIMLHFWMGLLHPYEDGNGRLARVLFYWYMLKKEYWAFSYLSLSEKIQKSAKQYAMAYVYSEQDDNDLNYFIHYNISKLKLARQHFQEYVKRKITENREIAFIAQRGLRLNQRQLHLLQYLARHGERYTMLTEYQRINAPIGTVTAASDLKRLVSDGFLKKVRNGRNIYYYPTPKINTIFKNT